MNTNPANQPDPKCNHDRIEIIEGGGDENGFYDVFECDSCGWRFELLTDGREEY